MTDATRVVPRSPDKGCGLPHSGGDGMLTTPAGRVPTPGWWRPGGRRYLYPRWMTVMLSRSPPSGPSTGCVSPASGDTNAGGLAVLCWVVDRETRRADLPVLAIGGASSADGARTQ